MKAVVKAFNVKFEIKKEPIGDYKEPTEKEILAGIKQGLKEVKLHQEGKIKLRTLTEFLADV